MSIKIKPLCWSGKYTCPWTDAPYICKVFYIVSDEMGEGMILQTKSICLVEISKLSLPTYVNPSMYVNR